MNVLPSLSMRAVHHRTILLDKSNDTWNNNRHPSAKSLKGILLRVLSRERIKVKE